MKFLEIESEGQPNGTLVLLHGYGGRAQDWQNVLKHGKLGVRILMPQLSEIILSREPLSFSAQVQLLKQFLNENIPAKDPVFLGGISYGATLALGTLTEFSSRVQAAILMNPMPFFPLHSVKHPLLKTFLKAAKSTKANTASEKSSGKSTWGQLLMREVGHIFNIPGADLPGATLDSRRVKLIESAVQRFLWIEQNENWEVWLDTKKKWEVPALILHSVADPLFDEEQFQKIGSQFSACTYKRLAGNEHSLTETHPDKVYEALKNVIDHHLNSKRGPAAAGF